MKSHYCNDAILAAIQVKTLPERHYRSAEHHPPAPRAQLLIGVALLFSAPPAAILFMATPARCRRRGAWRMGCLVAHAACVRPEKSGPGITRRQQECEGRYGDRSDGGTERDGGEITK
jgi:hypothetical protein